MSSWDDESEATVAEKVEKYVPLADGIHRDVSFENYLKEDRVSKSLLWDTFDRSPAHARQGKEESNAMKVGTATHCVLLEPDMFRTRFVRGPDDRRGNKWKDAVAMAAADGRDLGLEIGLVDLGADDRQLEGQLLLPVPYQGLEEYPCGQSRPVSR